MSHLDEQIAEAMTHGPDTLTYILAQALTRAKMTLERAGFRDCGGELWKPALGPSAAPMLDEIARLRARVAELEATETILRGLVRRERTWRLQDSEIGGPEIHDSLDLLENEIKDGIAVMLSHQRGTAT